MIHRGRACDCGDHRSLAPPEAFGAASQTLGDVARGERQPGDGIDRSVVGQPQSDGIPTEMVGQLVDTAFQRKAGRVLERRAHVARGLHVGAHEPFAPAEILDPV